ncbi:hypothetical protein ACFSTE_18030 [Aquimarina hainanensis]|uniref:Uncharacterized protein n=1 Tax=Aquimarina hainanensis TaxID=1578017 RepID=A0ABW5ND19_9FLAO
MKSIINEYWMENQIKFNREINAWKNAEAFLKNQYQQTSTSNDYRHFLEYKEEYLKT